MAKRDGEAIFDIVAGFVHSQILMALVELGLLTLLRDRPANPAALAGRTGIAPHRLEVLLRGGVALGLLKRRRDGRFTLTRQGAALPGVPGLQAMIRHHGAFYRDLEDPVAFLRDGSETELARFWPYVFGASGEVDPEVARTYSDLMADSQGLVAEETLRHVSLRDTKCLMDVGGGSGAFLIGAMARNPAMKAVLFDLPEVMPAAEARLGRAGLSDRVRRVPGSFRDDPLPTGADTISLVRVLYDHADETVALLLRRVRMALEPGGRLIVSEPMTGGARPERPGDTYFAFYTMAMGTGRTRSAAEISRLLKDAGFRSVTPVRTRRPFVTGVVVAET